MTDNRSHRQLQLDISSDSQVANVTVYPDRAEVTRVFRLQLEAGKTAVTFTGGFVYRKTLPVFSRLEKEGDVTLHDVEVTETSPEDSPSSKTTNPTQALEEEKELLEASLSRSELAPVLFDNYVKQLDLQKMTITSLDEVLNAYDQQGRKWDKKIQALKKDIHDLEVKITEAKKPTADSTPAQAEGPLFSNHLVKFTLEASGAVDVEVRLVYFVMEASWDAEYDVAVESTRSEDEEMKLTLTYKAVVINNTAEAWENVGLGLESASFTKQKERLVPWILAFDGSEVPNPFLRTIPNFSHTFADNVYIPEGTKQTVVIAQLQPQVLFERYCTPSVDYRVRVEGKITNSSEHPFRAGNAKIYLDGDYHADSQLDSIAVGETWSILLGFDSKVRVSYPPFTKTTAETANYRLSNYDHRITHECYRRITILNMRKVTIVSLTIIGGHALGGGVEISSNLVTPPLRMGNNLPIILTDGIPHDSHVSARWDRIHHPAQKPEFVGMSGLVNWECKIGPLREIHLDFSWTVTTTNGLGRIRGFQ